MDVEEPCDAFPNVVGGAELRILVDSTVEAPAPLSSGENATGHLRSAAVQASVFVTGRRGHVNGLLYALNSLSCL
jgi:hypothetical protein